VRLLTTLALLLLLAATASAADVRGTARGNTIVGTPRPDVIRAGAGNDFVQVAFGGVDRVDCGPGIDVVSADTNDHIAKNCEIVARRLSLDPYRNTDSQHETAVEPDSFSAGSTVVAAFQVGRREAGAAANIGTAVSHDAGVTWQRGALPGVTVNAGGSEAAASDPTVAFDAVHGAWLVATLTIHQGGSNIEVAHAADGLHWSAPVVAATGPVLDKDWVACDNGPTSPFRGRCYLEYTDDDKNMTVSQFTSDGGLTWSPAVRAGSTLVGTQPVVLPNGTLVVVAGDYRGDAALSGSLIALRSKDGGATFAPSTVATLDSASNPPMRAASLPSVDVDSDGTIYAAWHDCRFRPGCTADDIVVSTSTDGATWSTPTRVPLSATSSTLSAFITGLAADPVRPGHLGLVYAYFHPGTRLLGIGFVQSADAGRTWTKPQRLDTQPMSTSWLPRSEGGRMVGDYFSVSYSGGRVVPVFTLAAPLLDGRFREAIFAASLRALR